MSLQFSQKICDIQLFVLHKLKSSNSPTLYNKQHVQLCSSLQWDYENAYPFIPDLVCGSCVNIDCVHNTRCN